jgi:hypothetical protein
MKQRLEKEVAQNVVTYNTFFKQHISPSIAKDVVEAMEPFVPGLLSTATLNKKRLEDIVNLQIDTVIRKESSGNLFFYQTLLTSLTCVASILLYFSQRLNCQYVEGELNNKKLLARQGEITRVAKKIESLNEHIKEQKKLLGDVRVYIEQNRAWCELFNGLQHILAEAGDVYMDSFTWGVQVPKKVNAQAVGLKGTAKKVAEKKAAENAQETKTDSEALKVTSMVDMSGVMFIGNVLITDDVKRDFNGKFNAMFDKIRQLPICSAVDDIKVNVPENGKITFRCRVMVNPKSKIMAL